MNESKHTLGPWRVTDSGRLVEARVSPWGWNIIAELPGFADADARKANARLIAAAPALVEALRKLSVNQLEPGQPCPFCGWEEVQDINGDTTPSHDENCPIRAARAALALAEGRTP